jgi:sulfofructose kinase
MNSLLKMDREREFGVVGFGTNAVDHLITVPFYPEFDSKVRLSAYQRAAGGEVASTVTGLSRLGIKTAYIGRFGSDSEGSYGIESLEKEGVDVSQAEIVEGASTQIAFILIDQTSGERTVIWDRDPKLAYSADDVPRGLVMRSSILHCTPHDISACMELADEARQNGTVVSMDIDNLFEGIEKLLPRVDVLIASRDLPAKLTGKSADEEALEALRETYGCEIVGITLGDEGCLILSDQGLCRSEGYPVPGGCQDTTGAGDAFRAGFLYGMLQDFPLAESAKIGNAVAALKCRSIGARTALPSKAEVEELTGLDLSR